MNTNEWYAKMKFAMDADYDQFLQGKYPEVKTHFVTADGNVRTGRYKTKNDLRLDKSHKLQKPLF